VEHANVREMIEDEKLEEENPELVKMIKEDPTLSKFDDR
jgi:hypothetical protein